MKNYLYILLLLTVSTGYAQDTTNAVLASRYATLGKIWGFLKYYHPAVASGKVEWDNEFIKVAAQIEQAKDDNAVSDIYSNLLMGLGEIKPCQKCSDTLGKEYFNKNFNLKWLEKVEQIDNTTVNKLTYIKNNRYIGKPHYIKEEPLGFVKMQNEPEMPEALYPEKYYRLLSLCRFWNFIEYYYPYKYLTDQKWDDVLFEMIPKFINATTIEEYNMVMLEAIVKLDDSHALFKTSYTSRFFGVNFLPVIVHIVEGKAVVTGYYNKALSDNNNLQIGDIISEIDGKAVSDIISEKRKYLHGSNNSSRYRDTYYFLGNGNSESAAIKGFRKNIPFTKVVKRYPFDQVFVTSGTIEKYRVLKGNIGYIDLSAVDIKEVDQILDKMKSSTGIIIDLRKYPRGIPYKIANFIKSSQSEFASVYVPDLTYPGKFFIKERLTCGKANPSSFKGKVVLLVDEGTQSRGEFSTMLLQTSGNAITVGNQTAGADGNVTSVMFNNRYTSLITGTGILYPDGAQVQRIGVKLDVVVKPTIEGILQGRDEVLEKAMDIILY